jgi:hypothetical protein
MFSFFISAKSFYNFYEPKLNAMMLDSVSTLILSAFFFCQTRMRAIYQYIKKIIYLFYYIFFFNT